MPYQCSECENSFHSRKDQSKHRQEITQVGEGGAASERNYLCSECGKRYRRFVTLCPGDAVHLDVFILYNSVYFTKFAVNTNKIITSKIEFDLSCLRFLNPTLQQRQR